MDSSIQFMAMVAKEVCGRKTDSATNMVRTLFSLLVAAKHQFSALH
jgi:hypothetical protein